MHTRVETAVIATSERGLRREGKGRREMRAGVWWMAAAERRGVGRRERARFDWWGNQR